MKLWWERSYRWHGEKSKKAIGVLRCMSNFMMDEGDERVKASYGDNYERPAVIKGKYDPKNLFRVNQNIIGKVEN